MSRDALSLIVPNRDMAPFLSDALESIARQQTPVKEILLIDAGTTQESVAIAAQWRERGLPIEVIAAPGANPAQARNAGLAKATGDVIGFLDADDLFPTGKLASQLGRLAGSPRVDVVSGIITSFDRLDPATLAPAASSRIEMQTGVNLGACLIRRQVFDRIGVLDETQLYAEDTDFILRIFEARIPVTALRREVLYYRRHLESLMAQANDRKQRDFHRAIARSIKRRSALGLRGNLPNMQDLLEPAALGNQRNA
ncbi:MAG TPA: glycosyltransferase family A protein [Myxococcota bacterium]